MRTKSFSAKKLLSIVLAVAMLATMILPTGAFAAITEPTAVATVVENAGGGQTKTITVTFAEMVVLDDTAELDTDIFVAGKTFGASTMEIVAETQKDIVITLADDATVEVGDVITFANDKIINAEDNTDFFNGDIEIAGSLDCAAVEFAIVPNDATVTVDGYTAVPGFVGTGEFNYKVEKDGYVTVEDSFEVAAEDLGDTVVIEVELELAEADYTALDNAITEAEAIDADGYTESSFAAFAEALENAKNVDKTLKSDEQDVIDDLLAALDSAMNALVSKKVVEIDVFGVSENLEETYGKVTKVIVIFAESIDADASKVLENLSIVDEVASAEWADGSDNTVLTLTLNADADLPNDLAVTYTASDDVKTLLSGAVVDTITADAIGNFEGSEELVTATSMAATIVKGTDKPGVAEGDKIVIVFNAPVKGNPAAITVNGMNADVVDNTGYTVYQIVLTSAANVDNDTVLTYETMSTTLDGSFGTATAPVITGAYAVDNDGEATIAGDQIVITFDRPTNGAELDLTKAGIVVNQATTFGTSSTYEWLDNDTTLVITLGENANIENGVKLDLRNQGIKDAHNSIDADIVAVVVEGSFGSSLEPKITRAIAFTQNNKHIIRVFFNTEVVVKENTTLDVYVKNFDTPEGKWTSNGISYYDIVLEDGHEELEAGAVIKFVGILVDKKTGKMELKDAEATISGGFEQDITPEIQSLTAYSQDGCGVAQAGDELVVVLSCEATKVTSNLGDFEKVDGNAVTWKYVITEEDVKNRTVEIGKTVSFTVKAFGKEVDLDAEIEGSYGYIVEPEIVSLTAYSKTGDGIAKANDELILVLNCKAENVTSNLGAFTKVDGSDVAWKYVITSEDIALNKVNLGATVSFTIETISGVYSNDDVDGDGYEYKIGGSYGYLVTPELISATAYSKDGSGIKKSDDEMVLVFNTPVLIEQTAISDLFGTAYCNSKGNTLEADTVWKVTKLNENNIDIGSKVEFKVISGATREEKTVNAKLGGSFGFVREPSIISVTAVNKHGFGEAAKAGDEIVVVFDMEVVVDGTTEPTVVYTYTLKNDGEYAVGKDFTVNVVVPSTGITHTLDGTITGSFGVKPENKIVSAYIYYSNGSEYIDVIFSGETNGQIDVNELNTKNSGLDATNATFSSKYNLRLTLANTSTIEENFELNLAELGITDITGAEIEVANLKAIVKGHLIPFVQEARVTEAGNVVELTFSTRTNGSADTLKAIEKQKYLYGEDVYAVWADNNTKLVITMSDDNTMSDNAYIVLNGLGIKDGFSGKHALVGQYKIDTTHLEKKTLNITSVFARANNVENAPREDATAGVKGDQIVVCFEDVTNMARGADGIENVEVTGEDSFGEGYTAKWETETTLVITLGENPVISIGSEIVIKDVKFANGTGYLAEGGAEEVTKEITGLFDGRAFWIEDCEITEVGGRSRVTATVKKADITSPEATEPYVVCQSKTKKGVVISIGTIMLPDDVVETEVKFDFDAKNLATVEIFVLGGDYADIDAATAAWSDTVVLEA